MSNRRQHKLAELKDDNRFDVIVVGGGVNGIGVYRELSLQGLRVLLIEKNDFCSGCSAAPSRSRRVFMSVHRQEARGKRRVVRLVRLEHRRIDIADCADEVDPRRGAERNGVRRTDR